MIVEVISETKQVFNGVNYYLMGNYYRHTSKKFKGSWILHRTVWAYHNGEIPKGLQVHHKDTNPSNNQIENLVLLTQGAHLAEHTEKNRNNPIWLAKKRKHMQEQVMPKAKAWHGSKEGKEWHRQNYEKMKEILHSAPRTAKTYNLNCLLCTKPFTASIERAKWCSLKCTRRVSDGKRRGLSLEQLKAKSQSIISK
jgi:hypothetical protein